ncbi:hypothetical protein BGZ79_002310 [Entomortierella chlamydospora]|nr:hypothetical protein BGZ79_002310 [Entomortierella chlamydospora]
MAMAAPQPNTVQDVAHVNKKHTTTTKKHTTTTKKHTTTTKKHTTTTKKHTTTTKKHTTTTTAHTTTKATTKATTTTAPTATPTSGSGKAGQTGVILSQTDFCIFLPPKFGGDIAANEDRAVAFCTKPNLPGANAQVLPAGFIKSAHFVTNTQKGYVQVTGLFDRTKYGLSAKDGGGQYDMRAPVGALCSGYKSFVQLTEPDTQMYCIRCCQNKADCPVNKSTYGCEKVLGGDYS